MIAYRGFTKRFDGQRAVDDLSLDIARGSVVALLGPNGSGKTTTIKAAAGLIRPTKGDVLLGIPPMPASDPGARRRCSFLPQRVSFPDALSGREVIEFYRRLRGTAAEATDRVLTFAALNGSSGRAVSTYSGGMLQRLGLAVAMLPDAEILLLDEPSAALDPEGLAALYALIDERRRRGVTVFFSSHQLSDVERMADQIAVLVDGRLVALMEERELRARLADRGVMRVRVASCTAPLLACVRAVAGAAELVGDELVIPGPSARRPMVLDVIRGAGGDIRGLTAHEGRLDDFYRAAVQEHS